MGEKALIWDLDGTLLDSYGIIVPSMARALAEAGAAYPEEAIHRYVIDHSVGAFWTHLAGERPELDMAAVRRRFTAINNARDMDIRPMPHARELLERLEQAGVRQFVYTHKGPSAAAVLEHIGVLRYFAEVIHGHAGFPLKPAPDGVNYLVEKYRLDRSETYYAGDRRLDVECAQNAGVRSILYLPPASPGRAVGDEDHVVRDLLEIADILGA